MKTIRLGMHSVYCLVIITLMLALLGVNRMRMSAKEKLLLAERSEKEELLMELGSLAEEMAGDFFSIAEADSKQIYVMKLSELQTTTGQAGLMLSQKGRQTPWGSFWKSLKTRLERELSQAIEADQVDTDEKLWIELANLMEWLSKNPEAFLDESTKSLPEELSLPTLQTAYEIEEERTVRVAEKVFGVRGGLRKLANTPPGVRSYVCDNGRADVLQSGELLYFSLSLSPKEGEIGEDMAAEIFLDFAQKQGLSLELIDLYSQGDRIIGKMVPSISVAQLGRIPDLDRTVEIACTRWSGRICYFSAGQYYTAASFKFNGLLLHQTKIEEIAAKRGARIGEPFRYMGRVCLPLVYQRGGYSGRSVLCIDAVNGNEVDLFYVTRTGNSVKRLF